MHDLFENYGRKIFYINLMKQSEKIKREEKLNEEFKNAVEFINNELPRSKRMLYI